MSYADVNFAAILAAGIASMVLGFVWYSPMLFGNAFMKSMGWDPNDTKRMGEMKKGMGATYMMMFFGTLISAYVLAQFLTLTQAIDMSDALKVGAMAWLGFMFPVLIGSTLFSGRTDNGKWVLYAINAGHYLVGILLMSTILIWWK